MGAVFDSRISARAELARMAVWRALGRWQIMAPRAETHPTSDKIYVSL
jgi:hypothetical protein